MFPRFLSLQWQRQLSKSNIFLGIENPDKNRPNLISRSANLKIIEKLLNFGCKLTSPGWIRVGDFDDFATPLVLSSMLKDSNTSFSAKKLAELIHKHCENEWDDSSFEGD